MLAHSPKVSVLMAVYNGADYLEEALAGVLQQSFKDFEFLIFDDGSTDRTPEILGRLTDPRVRIVRQVRMGLTRSLIRGVGLASGEYIARQDADDIPDAERLSKQVAFLDAELGVALVGTGVTLVTEDNRPIRDITYPPDHEHLVAELRRLISPLPHTTIMFRRRAMIDCGGYREFFAKAQDYDLYLRLSETWRLASIPALLSRLRLVRRSVTLDDEGGSQFQYAVLALVASVARRERGIDPLDRPTRQDFLARFQEWYVSSRYPERFRSRLLRRHARLAWSRRDPLGALRYLGAATLAYPGWVIGQLGVLPAEYESAEALRWIRDQYDKVA